MKRRLAAVLLALLTATLLTAAEVARPHVLVTNDDGIDAPGLVALADALKADYRITVVAPVDNQSAVGHGITYRTPVLVEERPGTEGVRRFAVYAQPATCTRIAVTALLAADPPVLVLSGINRGDNAGRSVWISGTVAGAREGALAGFPAVAFSAVAPRGSAPDYAAAARWARLVLLRLREAGLPAPGQVVKVEIPHPAGEARGVTVTRVSMVPAREERYEEKAGPGGERLFVSRFAPPETDVPGTDVRGLADGFVTVTSLTLDQTDYRGLPALMAVPWAAAPLPAATPAP
jgi:5'-nucleotidase